VSKEKIEFFNGEPGIIDNYPIIEAKNLKLKWVESAKKDFQNLVKVGADKIPGFNHMTRCPGIFDMFKYGYIVFLHKDLLIKPHEESFESLLAGENQGLPELSKIVAVDNHSLSLLAKPPWASNFAIKISTGWHVIAPKGVKFIMLPIAYPDTYEFTSTIGIVNPSIETQINFQLYWNGIKEETLIKAGTPLGQLIPLSEKKYEMVQREMNQRDHDWIVRQESAYFSTFWRNTMRKKVQNMYNKFWKK
tara:strand:+ start:62 stop:805 length:744 start_codon:yes stop_codon:yes gene_type:complete